MKRFKEKKYYLLTSFLVIAITLVIYKGVDNLIVTQKQQKIINAVYLVPINKIPVLKEKLPQNLLNLLNEPNPIFIEEVLPSTNSGQITNLNKNNLSYEVFAQSISAKSAYVEDLDTGTVLFERNSDRILLPASTTKLMTALVALEEYQLDKVLVVSQLPSIEGFQYEFIAGEKIKVRDLLKAALIQSSNDAAYVLAMSSQNGIDGFVERMNQKAIELNLKSTKYENPAGFDDDTQRSSAHDLVILSRKFMEDDFLASVVATKEVVFTDVSGKNTHHFYSTHQLLGVDPTVVGIKTGTTQGAAQVLITQFKRENHSIIIVVMGSDDRYLETTKLIDWVFEAYVWIDPKDLMTGF